MRKINLSKVFFIISVFIFGTISLFVKNINLSSEEIALYRAMIAFSCLFVFLVVQGKLVSFERIKKQIISFAISGALMGFNWILLFESYNYTSVSVATLAYYFAPVIVTFVSSFVFKEKLSAKNKLCILFSFLGIILVSGIIEDHFSKSNFIGFLLAFLAAIFYACVILLNKTFKDVDAINRTLIQFAFAIVVLLPYVLIKRGINIFSIDDISLINLLILGIVHTGIVYCLYFYSIKNMLGQEIGILSYIDPVVAICLSVIVLEETMSLIQYIGSIIIIVFAIVNEIRFKKNIVCDEY